MRLVYTTILIGVIFSLPAQVQDFKVMSYNLMYYKAASAPCTVNPADPAKDQNFKTIFKATTPDILCVNELGAYTDNSAARSILNNVINTDGESSYKSAGYSNNGFSDITNNIFYDTTLFTLSSQDFISKDVNSANLVRVIDFYRFFYNDPGLSFGADTTFFTVVVAHLKAGNGSANQADRELAAEAVMDYLTNNVSDENVILCGDMNLYGSNEDAYQEYTNYSVSSENFVDPTFAGSWNNNSTYAPIHTQSTHSSSSNCFSGGGLDDRFDFIMFSQAVSIGNQKMLYKTGSLEAFGNDGSHFNQSINSGTNGVVSQAVANALYDFSDHLPITAIFEVAKSGIGLPELPLGAEFTYSNPFGNELIINKEQATPEAFDIFVLDLTGKVIFKTDYPTNQNQLKINTNSWHNGIYLLSIIDKSGAVITKKLVKQ